MRRAEEIIILQRLLRVSRLVASGDAQRVVELEAAFAAPLQIDAEIFAWSWKIMIVLGARCGLGIDQFAEALLRLAARDHHLPGLAVAPGRRALCDFEDVLDGL